MRISIVTLEPKIGDSLFSRFVIKLDIRVNMHLLTQTGHLNYGFFNLVDGQKQVLVFQRKLDNI